MIVAYYRQEIFLQLCPKKAGHNIIQPVPVENNPLLPVDNIEMEVDQNHDSTLGKRQTN